MYSLNFKQLCRNHGITLSELSKRTLIPQPSLSRYASGKYASGKSNITLRQLSRIALALNVELEEILQNNILTEKYREEISRKERDNRKQDKAWVTRVLCDLQSHYSKVR
jgi:transcriptional regulator with XRE-family HTH domain